MITNIDENFCFICYELKIKREKKPKKLKNQKIYIKTCECDGLIHNECLKKWYLTSQRCPICREIMFDKKGIVAAFLSIDENQDENQNQPQNQVTTIQYGIRMRIYLYIQKNWFKVASIANILFLFYAIFSFYNSVFNARDEGLI